MKSVMDNCLTVQQTLQQVADSETSEVGTKANGMATIMQTFQFLFSLRTAMLIYERTEMLSKTVPSATMTVGGAAAAADKTCQLLQHSREDEEWTNLWASVLSQGQALGISDPVVPRARRPPVRFDSGGAAATMTPEQHFRRVFNDFLDNILNTIRDHLQLYCTIEKTIILCAASGTLSPNEMDEGLAAKCQHYMAMTLIGESCD